VAGSPDDESGGRKENEQNNPDDDSDVFLILRGAVLFLWDVAIDTYNRHEFFNYECPLGKPAGHECEGQPE
jgi:hypothetical protein